MFLVLPVIALAQTAPSKSFVYSLPGLRGAIEIQLGPMKVEEASFRPEGDGLRVLAKDTQGLVMSLFLEKAPRKGTRRDCRDEWCRQTVEALPGLAH